MAREPASSSSRTTRRRPALRFVLALLVAAVLAGVWLWTSDTATRLLLDHVPGLQAEGVRGRLGGGPFAIERLVWQRGGLRVTVEGLSWKDVHWRLRPHPGAWLGIHLVDAGARHVRVATTPGPQSAPTGPPSSLRLPITLDVPHLSVGTFVFNDRPPVTGLQADVLLGANAGHEHRIANLDGSQAGLRFEGRLSVGAAGDLPLDGRLRLFTQPGATPSWQLAVAVDGPLQRPRIDARFDATRGVQAQADVVLAPFARFPLAELEASFEQLNLAAWADALPATALSGRAALTEASDPQTSRWTLQAANAAPGSWSGGRLPLSTLRVDLRADMLTLQRVQFDALRAELVGTGPAGHITGDGAWDDGTLRLAVRLDGVHAGRLDRRAPPVTLDGALRLTIAGLPSSGGRLEGEAHADLAGRLEAAQTPVRLLAEATFAAPGDGRISANVPRLLARAGAARLEGSLDAQRGSDGAWRLRSRGALDNFDPALWWPGFAAADSDLDGRWQADLALPAATPHGVLAALRGDAELVLGDSLLAGVPLQGRATLAGSADALRADARLQAGGNRIELTGRDAADAQHARWSLRIAAPALAALGPLFELLPGAAPWAPAAGALQADAVVRGRWPDLHTEGSLQANDLRTRQLQLARAAVRWSFAGSRPDAPLSLQLTLAGLVQAPRRIDRFDAELSGRVGDHRLRLDAALPLEPPAWTDAAGGRTSAGSVVELRGDGGWQPQGRGGLWRGTVTSLRAAPAAVPQSPWLSAADVGLRLRVADEGRLQMVALAPGRLRLFGGRVQWSRALWEAGQRPGEAAHVALDAELQPLQVAPLLSRLQPEQGWRGDLAIDGRIALRTRGGVLDGVAVLERHHGDLAIATDGEPRALGLEALRFELTAAGRQWSASERIAGSRIGVLEGRQAVRLAPGSTWPGAAATVDGDVRVQVPDLSAWTPWLPPGWRIGGQLRAALEIDGRIGAPQLSGEVVGSELALRQLFHGIYLDDGTLSVSLHGTEATLRELRFRGPGEGQLTVQGRASLGTSPSARLHATADGFRVLDRVDRRITVSGEADLALRDEKLRLEGDLLVDQGLVDVTQADAPQLDDDVVVINRAAAPHGPRPGQDRSLMAQAAVNLTLNLGENLRVRGRGLDTRLAGRLRVTTEGDDGEALALHGRVRTVEGRYAAYGQNLVIERGVLTFSGAPANPRLEILAVRPDIDERVGVTVSGQAADPRIRLYSEPDMPEIDQLTWLVLGRAPTGVGEAETALLQRAALALLAGEGGGGTGLLRNLGLDEVSIGRAESGAAAGEAVISLGKQLSERLSVGYEQALASVGGTWQLIYRLAGRVTLRARAGADNAIEAVWTWRWE